MTFIQKNALIKYTLSNDWSSSTKNPDIFFAGSSPTDYTLQCSHGGLGKSVFQDPGTVLGFGWQHQFEGVRFAHTVTIGTGELAPEDRHNVMWRAVCHYLVDAVPEPGLSDVAESLASLYEFYREMPEPAPALPPKEVTGSVERAYQRPIVDFAGE